MTATEYVEKELSVEEAQKKIRCGPCACGGQKKAKDVEVAKVIENRVADYFDGRLRFEAVYDTFCRRCKTSHRNGQAVVVPKELVT